MKDIEIINNNTQAAFRKKLWHETELILAKCFNFHVDVDNGIIICDLHLTSKKSLYEFIKLGFKSFSEAPDREQERTVFFEQVDAIYVNLMAHADSFSQKNLPYYNNLYNHQKEVIAESFYKKYNFLALDMGLGKTLTSASISRVHQVPLTVIMCPSAVKWNWLNDLFKFGYNQLYFTMYDAAKRRTFRAFQERFVILNYDIIDKFGAELMTKDIGHFILDECFVYDTMIQTNLGAIKIGDIVEKKINCYALSYDSLNNAYIYKPIYNWLKKPLLNKRLVKIKVNEKEIICTEDHKIYTKNGYKKAIHISNSDHLLAMQNSFNEEKEGSLHSEILQHKVFNGLQKKRSDLQEEFIRWNKKIKTSITKKLRSVRKGVFCNKISFFKKKILLPVLFGKLEDEQSGVKVKEKADGQRSSLQENESFLCSESIFSSKQFGKNEKKQPNEESGKPSKNEEVTSGKNISFQGRERSINGASEITELNDRMGYGIFNRHEKRHWFSKFTEKLQGRFSYSRTQNSNRSRREQSQDKKMEIFGQEKNGDFKFFRVESCEVLERGSSKESDQLYREGYVYDLSVEDNHNYFANGILVSNCHNLKNHLSNRSKNVTKIVHAFPDARITFLSGTPIKNRVNDIFAYLKLIGHELGHSHKKFLDQFTVTASGRGGDRVTGGKNLQDLHIKLSNFMIRRTKEECLDLPDKIFLQYKYEMDDYREDYNKIIEEMSQQKSISSLTGNIHSLNIITAKAKEKGIIELAETIIAEGRKVVIFGGYKDPLNSLQSYFKERCVKIDGSVESFMRNEMVQQFINDPECVVFLGNWVAAGVGINLVNASDIIVQSFPLTPSELHQGIDRLHRIGQGKSVNVHYTFCEDSIDEHIFSILEDKEGDMNAVIDQGKEVLLRENINEILIKKLLNRDDIVFDNHVSKAKPAVTQEETTTEPFEIIPLGLTEVIPKYYLIGTEDKILIFNEKEYANLERKEIIDIFFYDEDILKVISKGQHVQRLSTRSFNAKYTPNPPKLSDFEIDYKSTPLIEPVPKGLLNDPDSNLAEQGELYNKLPQVPKPSFTMPNFK